MWESLLSTKFSHLSFHQALSLLTYLLNTVAPQDLVDLDPFPEDQSFTALTARQVELRQEVGGATLLDEIQRFLIVGEQCPQAGRTEALSYLQKQLHNSKLQLASLVKQGKVHIINKCVLLLMLTFCSI